MSRTTKSLVAVCFCLTGFLLPQVAAAGSFTSAAITGVSSLQVGPFVIASDLGDVSSPTVISGVGTFDPNAGGYFSGSNFSGGGPVAFSDTDLNSLLQTQRYNPTLSTGTVGSGIPVIVGRHYVLELLFFDPNGPATTRTMTINAESDTFIFPSVGGTKSKVDYDFIAGDTSLDVSLSVVTDNSTISGFSLLDITLAPEPGVLSLLSLGILGFMRVARRRRYRSLYGRI